MPQSLRNYLKSFSSRRGVSDSGVDNLIVSLTSFGERIAHLPATLDSLLRQSHRPDRILVWIGTGDFGRLTARCRRFEARGVEFVACQDLRSYTKFHGALSAYPESVLVTADDDVIYPVDWLRHLYEEHLRHPADVVCHRARLITFDQKGSLYPYRYWPNLGEALASDCVLPLGVGGVLYPPGCFHADVLKSEIFTRLAPAADDLWLKTMTYLAGTRSRKIQCYRKNFKDVRGGQQDSLRTNNVRSGNDEQVSRLFSHYGIFGATCDAPEPSRNETSPHDKD